MVKSIRKIPRPPDDILSGGGGDGDYALVDEPSMITKKSKYGNSLRFALEIIYRVGYDIDEDSVVKSVIALYPHNSYLHKLDSGTELEFDDNEGTIKFSSSGNEYVIRAIQPDDGDSWDLLQNWNRYIDPQNSARS